jgi:hypothetical protein
MLSLPMLESWCAAMVVPTPPHNEPIYDWLRSHTSQR